MQRNNLDGMECRLNQWSHMFLWAIRKKIVHWVRTWCAMVHSLIVHIFYDGRLPPKILDFHGTLSQKKNRCLKTQLARANLEWGKGCELAYSLSFARKTNIQRWSQSTCAFWVHSCNALIVFLILLYVDLEMKRKTKYECVFFYDSPLLLNCQLLRRFSYSTQTLAQDVHDKCLCFAL